MALKIDPDECISCGACEPDCPTNSIKSGKLAYEINKATCTECCGDFPEPHCVEVCPIDGCITPLVAA